MDSLWPFLFHYLNSNLKDYLTTRNVDVSYSVTASDFGTFTFTAPTIEGYSARFVVPVWSGNANVVFTDCRVDNYSIRLRNLTTATVTGSARVCLVYVRNIL